MGIDGGADAGGSGAANHRRSLSAADAGDAGGDASDGFSVASLDDDAVADPGDDESDDATLRTHDGVCEESEFVYVAVSEWGCMMFFCQHALSDICPHALRVIARTHLS